MSFQTWQNAFVPQRQTGGITTSRAGRQSRPRCKAEAAAGGCPLQAAALLRRRNGVCEMRARKTPCKQLTPLHPLPAFNGNCALLQHRCSLPERPLQHPSQKLLKWAPPANVRLYPSNIAMRYTTGQKRDLAKLRAKQKNRNSPKAAAK